MTFKFNWRHDLSRGVQRAAAKRLAISADTDERVTRALAEGVAADARALSARLRISYHQARRSLIRLGCWKARGSSNN
jgi:hypothetical protein